MTTFILILTMYIGRAGQMVAIPAFSSRESCEASGVEYILKAKELKYVMAEPKFICIVGH